MKTEYAIDWSKTAAEISADYEAMAKQLDELREENEALRDDADRYRWLRLLDNCNKAWCLIGLGNAAANLDAAIDDARKGQ